MKRKDFMKLGVMFVCFSLAAGVSVFAAEQQPATKWQYTQKQGQAGILVWVDVLKLEMPGTWNWKLGMGVEGGVFTFYHKDSLNAGKKVRECYVHASLFLSEAIFPENMS